MLPTVSIFLIIFGKLDMIYILHMGQNVKNIFIFFTRITVAILPLLYATAQQRRLQLHFTFPKLYFNNASLSDPFFRYF